VGDVCRGLAWWTEKNLEVNSPTVVQIRTAAEDAGVTDFDRIYLAVSSSKATVKYTSRHRYPGGRRNDKVGPRQEFSQMRHGRKRKGASGARSLPLSAESYSFYEWRHIDIRTFDYCCLPVRRTLLQINAPRNVKTYQPPSRPQSILLSTVLGQRVRNYQGTSAAQT
jgi:hypothetical protein